MDTWERLVLNSSLPVSGNDAYSHLNAQVGGDATIMVGEATIDVRAINADIHAATVTSINTATADQAIIQPEKTVTIDIKSIPTDIEA